MEPRDLVRISILVTFGALALGIAAWLLAFALTGGASSASPFAAIVFVGGLLVLLAGVLVLGSAGADAVWARLQRLRERQR